MTFRDLQKEKKQYLSVKSSFFVGREKELQQFKEDFLFKPGSFILNIHTNGDGGVGKTQLLLQMLKTCRDAEYAEKIITGDELIDLYHTEARSTAGFIEQIIKKLGTDHFPAVVHQLQEYRRTKDSSERQYRLDDVLTALEEDYKYFADKSKEEGRIIVLFFDTYEVIQRIDQNIKEAHRTEFSSWLEDKFFHILRSDNTRLVIAGRYPILKKKAYITELPLALFDSCEAVDFLMVFLKNTADINNQEELLDELQLTESQLQEIIELSGYRPIYLALFMDWYQFNVGKCEPEELLEELNKLADEEKKANFEKAVIQWCWNDPGARKFIYPMAVAYRRMTPAIMQYLTNDSLENCQKILLKKLSPLSFIKHKKDKGKGDVILLHDEMRDLLDKHWKNWVDPDQYQQREIAKKLVRYYEDEFLSPDYCLTDLSFNCLQEQKIPEKFLGKLNDLNSLFFTEKGFRSALSNRLDQNELKEYADILIDAAKQDVLQEKREVYTPELIEYTFMAKTGDGVQRFCDEFDTAMEDGRGAYAALLGREAVFCCEKYKVSLLVALEIELREVQHYIDGNEHDIPRALNVIKSVNEQQQVDASWEGSLLFGKFKLWEGIAYFWLDKFDEAVRLLKEARGVFIAHEDLEDPIFLAENWIGYTYYRKADFNEAEGWMKQSLNGLLALLAREVKAGTRKKRNIQQRIQYTYGNLAMLYRYKGKFAESIRYAEAQYSIVESLPRNKKEIFRSLNTLAHVLAVAGRSMEARPYLEQAEKIYKEIPDPVLGGRLYSNFCWLSHDVLEFAYLIEYYRADELRDAIESKQQRLEKTSVSFLFHAEKAVKLLDQATTVSHKELADAYFKQGELYMLLPAFHMPNKWVKAEKAFQQALHIGRTSQFQYVVIFALENLVVLYYFWNCDKKLSSDKRKVNMRKQKEYQADIDVLKKELNCYPELQGRYELILGDIDFDQALDLLKEQKQTEDADFFIGIQLLEQAFEHYISSAIYQYEFNLNQYALVQRIIYNRLDVLVGLVHPRTSIRLINIVEPKEQVPDRPQLPIKVLDHLQKKASEWEHRMQGFSQILNYALLQEDIIEDQIISYTKKLSLYEEQGDYRQAVLLSRCLVDVYLTLVFSEPNEKKYKEQLVFLLNKKSQLHRLLGDRYHARQAYRASRSIIKEIADSALRKELDGYVDIIAGEFYFREGEYSRLLDFFVRDELELACTRFDKQFPGDLEKARSLILRGLAKLVEAEKILLQQVRVGPKEERSILEERIRGCQKKISEAYFHLGELLMMQGDFFDIGSDEPGALEYIRKAVNLCEKCKNDSLLDDAKQSYLNAIYFSNSYHNSMYQHIGKKYEQELEEKINNPDYKYPLVLARLRITQGDMLFSRCFHIEERESESSTTSYFFVPHQWQIERKELVNIFRKYIEACDYSAMFNELSFESGLRVLRRRVELIADSSSLDILYEILRHIWQDGEHLRKKTDELESILQLIRMRSLTGRLVQEYEK